LSFDEDAEVEGETSFERSMSFLPVDLGFFTMVLLKIGEPALRAAADARRRGCAALSAAREAGDWPEPHGS